MILHTKEEGFDLWDHMMVDDVISDIIFDAGDVDYITLGQHELDQMTDDVPAMSEEGL